MEKATAEVKSTNPMDRISELPEDILQRILYFVSQDDAVRTSVLSKSWRNIWCTRPNLDFSDNTCKGNNQQFLSVVDTTLQRYCDQRLRVEEFYLRIFLRDMDHEFVSLLEKWIRAPTVTGVKKLRFSNSSGHFSGSVDLPSVVFEVESLQDLRVERFVLGRDAIERIVVFKNLRSLCLEQVRIKDDVFEAIISNCPSIETLVVNHCKRLKTIKVSRLHNLKKFSFSKRRVDCSIEIHPPSLVTVNISDNIWLHDGGGYFRNLNSLRLWRVKSTLEHLSSCKFPSLELLNIFFCDGMMGIKLFIDAPKINNFRYAGVDFIPSISFATTTSGEWRSLLFIYLDDDSSSWLLELNELLESLSESEISLSISKKNFNPAVRGNGCDKPVVVENFNLECCVSYLSSILSDLFCICRPRFIVSDVAGKREEDVTECMWKILTRRESGDKDDELAQLLLRDLEEVRLEAMREGEFREGKWRPIFELPSYEQRIRIPLRFALKWRQTALSTS